MFIFILEDKNTFWINIDIAHKRVKRQEKGGTSGTTALFLSSVLYKIIIYVLSYVYKRYIYLHLFSNIYLDRFSIEKPILI